MDLAPVADSKRVRDKLTTYSINGRVVRLQPPVRVRWCRVADPLSQEAQCPSGYVCQGEKSTCPNCCFSYCRWHMDTHVRATVVPPDAWWGLYKRLATRLSKLTRIYVKMHEDSGTNRRLVVWEQGGRVVDHRPPARIEFCDVPSTGRVNCPCGYQSVGCTGGVNECRGCRFTYCDRHVSFHLRRIAVPWTVWQEVAARVERVREKFNQDGGGRRFIVRLPRIKLGGAS